MTEQLLPVYYANCNCFVWPLVPMVDVHRCGRCNVVPKRTSKDKEEAIQIFIEKNGHEPEPFPEDNHAERFTDYERHEHVE